jgi:hypothetical protein
LMRFVAMSRIVPSGQIQPQKNRPRSSEKNSISRAGSKSHVKDFAARTYPVSINGFTRKKLFTATEIVSPPRYSVRINRRRKRNRKNS